jgi:NAD/NADP transhydrogenase beta subunit
MTKMRELVAATHWLIGLAAVAIAYAVVAEPSAFGLAPPRVTQTARLGSAANERRE